MQNVKKLSRTAAVFLLAALILICSTVLPNTGTTVSAASAELTSIGLAEHALKAYRDGWQYSYGAYGNFSSNGVRASDCSGLIYSYFCWVDEQQHSAELELSPHRYGAGERRGGIRSYRYDSAHARPNCDHCEL